MSRRTRSYLSNRIRSQDMRERGSASFSTGSRKGYISNPNQLSSTMQTHPMQTSPICLKLKVKEHITDSGLMCSGDNQVDCNWNAILKNRLERIYPDMIVDIGKVDKKIVNVCISFTNRYATESDVYSKLNRFFYLDKSIVPESLLVE